LLPEISRSYTRDFPKVEEYYYLFLFFYGRNTGKTYLISAGIFTGSFLKNLGKFLKYQEISREKNEKAADIWRKNCRNFFLGDHASTYKILPLEEQ
jgi:hypothetical protein